MHLSQQTDPETLARLAFSYAPGIGPGTFHKLLHHFSTAHDAYTAHDRDLKPHFISQKQLDHFLVFRKSFSAHRTLLALNTLSVQYHTFSSLQRSIYICDFGQSPIGLFTQGDTNLLTSTAPTIAIIGSRKPTPYGTTVADDFASQLSRNGAIILSGLAIGIDSQAHTSCLEAGGKTIAILGTGHFDPHHSKTLRLYKAIVEHNGLIISEYPPGTPVHKGAFPARNRIIAGLADAVLLIEGAEHSGSRITAQYALDMGKELFCIPGSIYSPQSITPHHFIQQGAHLVSSPQDIYAHLHIRPIHTLTPTEKSILASIQSGSSTVQTLTQALAESPQDILVALSQLEARQFIVRSPEGTYRAPP